MSQINVKYISPLRGEIVPPPDKSISHRAVILASLANGKSTVRNFLYAEDPLSTVGAFRQMGIDIAVSGRGDSRIALPEAELTIHGRGLSGLRQPAGVIDCGNSGTTMRLLCGVLAGQPFSATLKGDQSLSRRPMKRVMEPLSRMGAVFGSDNGFPPLSVRGGSLKPIHFASPVASAQVKSAILLAGLYCDGVTSVSEPERSRDHTERMLRAAGVDVTVQGLTVSVNGKAALDPLDMTVPNDLSSAAFFMVAGTLVPGSEIFIKNVGMNPTRTGLLDILRAMGANIRTENEREVSGEPVADLLVTHSALTCAEIGGDLVPRAIDEFPVLCVAAALARGKTRITGAKELRVKESDRIATMAHALKDMGVAVEELEDGMIIEGRDRLKAATVKSHGDHRIAMSIIIAGLMADGETTVTDTDCIRTSFPGFMGSLEKLQK